MTTNQKRIRNLSHEAARRVANLQNGNRFITDTSSSLSAELLAAYTDPQCEPGSSRRLKAAMGLL